MYAISDSLLERIRIGGRSCGLSAGCDMRKAFAERATWYRTHLPELRDCTDLELLKLERMAARAWARRTFPDPTEIRLKDR
jgi:hypothetical protein